MVGHRSVDTHAEEEDWIKGLSVFPSCRRRRGTSPELVLSPNLTAMLLNHLKSMYSCVRLLDGVIVAVHRGLDPRSLVISMQGNDCNKLKLPRAQESVLTGFYTAYQL
ncbi:hypothetical protein AAC387_Pa11g0529 [Persea americana]